MTEANEVSATKLRHDTPEMVERVALGICHHGSWLSRQCVDPCNGCKLAARAAIEAMRVPTQAMIEEADYLMPYSRGTETHSIAGGRVPEDYWQAMIDAALGKPLNDTT